MELLELNIPSWEFWNNPTTWGAVVAIIFTAVGGFLASWNGAQQNADIALERFRRENADAALLAIQNGQTRISAQGDQAAQTHQEILERLRRSTVSELLEVYRLTTNAPLPAGYGKDWWPIEWINSQLADKEERFFVAKNKEGRLEYITGKPRVPMQ
jgi:hypothetical protein